MPRFGSARKARPSRSARPLNHLVRALHQRLRDHETGRLRGVEIANHFDGRGFVEQGSSRVRALETCRTPQLRMLDLGAFPGMNAGPRLPTTKRPRLRRNRSRDCPAAATQLLKTQNSCNRRALPRIQRRFRPWVDVDDSRSRTAESAPLRALLLAPNCPATHSGAKCVL